MIVRDLVKSHSGKSKFTNSDIAKFKFIGRKSKCYSQGLTLSHDSKQSNK